MTHPVSPIRLGVNVDHVATVRNARGGLLPDPVRAAELACAAGADGITAHLREDRRHIRDADMRRLRQLSAPLNFEMAATDEMVALAIELKPHACCLVPERREERTTEGGLDVIGGGIDLAHKVEKLGAAGIRVSLFVAPDEDQIARAADIGAAVIELHTGAWCDFIAAGRQAEAEAEFARLKTAAGQGAGLGLEIHAGHGLDYATAETIAAVEPVRELNIGHFLIGEAIFVGLEEAIRQMRAAMARGRARIGAPRAA
ncbi:pyridoxal phosphate biosynthetic protein PdxJ [Ancylobacter novellus DSM 506]|uniref:Pyridoxine 5'-phosphate synthase n=1 Tax=Ancylobacter novellus (strain ATCC 8093 / DSM 506 / JCM 20403 / CCM 1077 / IAM 12100 / NBRC 12443 / NCIMB 10456) TaxID=639283 RepID=D7AAD5_ANCN5|nr:pyridoxine 5'-phosphate synthase [Ancylobacter novellus]ADH88938.1 pyridoxal phosphate biosynthetic protein PdxJ [Ancylobacter novellus DSM 506]